jgi:hypothetical protein
MPRVSLTKQLPKYRFINYIILLLFIILLFVVLLFLQKGSTTNTKTTKENDQNIILVDKSNSEYRNISNSNDRIPVYPKELPQYSPPREPLDYQQVGILTSNEEAVEPIILPLFGRKVYGRSDRWQYYTATDKNNMMRIPLQYQNRDCEDDTGCDEIYTGDVLTVDIYQGRQFTATIYKVDAPRYFASRY